MSHVVLYVADAVAVWTLGAAIAAVVVTVIGIFVTVYYARKAPTVEGLGRVETNTGRASDRLEAVETHIKSVDDRLKEQQVQAEVEQIARGVSIKVSGVQTEANGPLEIVLQLISTDATLASIDLLNELGVYFGSSPCVVRDFPEYYSAVGNVQVAKWFSGGTVESRTDIKRVVIRAILIIGDRQAPKEFSVTLSSQLKPVPNGRAYLFALEGAC